MESILHPFHRHPREIRSESSIERGIEGTIFGGDDHLPTLGISFRVDLYLAHQTISVEIGRVVGRSLRE
jgi:hypothetical protein